MSVHTQFSLHHLAISYTYPRQIHIQIQFGGYLASKSSAQAVCPGQGIAKRTRPHHSNEKHGILNILMNLPVSLLPFIEIELDFSATGHSRVVREVQSRVEVEIRSGTHKLSTGSAAGLQQR
jgi:hypothetical protein